MTDNHKACSVDGCPHNAHWDAGGTNGMCFRRNYRNQKYGTPLGGRTFVGAPREFLEKHLQTPPNTDECVLWPFAKNSAGYGHLIVNGKHTLVHRIVCEKRNGISPDAQPYAAHSCGKGHMGCINERHLRWASPAENTADAYLHGTGLQGEKAPWSRLNDQLALEILISEAPSKAWAAALGVNYGTITSVRRRNTWKHVVP